MEVPTMDARSYVIDPAGGKRAVKNLGYILRNWQGIEAFRVDDVRGLSSVNGNSYPADCLLTAHFRDGRKFVTEYASVEVLAGFLDRPVFRGLEVSHWRGKGGKLIGKYVIGPGLSFP
jgi:hypothetical protein